jgi:hypothetical protein
VADSYVELLNPQAGSFSRFSPRSVADSNSLAVKPLSACDTGFANFGLWQIDL